VLVVPFTIADGGPRSEIEPDEFDLPGGNRRG
jgi:hypothetical protein